jgi:C-terminal processing protease CtpA/Prc
MHEDGLFKIIKKTFIRFGLIGVIFFICITGCASDDDPNKNEPKPPNIDSEWVEGVFKPAFTFEALCEHPRSGIDPTSGSPYPDVQGTLLDEMNWQRSWSNDVYLWYDEITDRNPADYNDKLDYFDLLKTEEFLPSGNSKDMYHFTYDTEEWIQHSQSGAQFGYGVKWMISQKNPPREIIVAYTEPNTSATNPPANLSRGARVIEVDGIDAINGSIDNLIDGLFPEEDGETHRFTVLDLGSDTPRTFSMQAGNFIFTPVQFVQSISVNGENVGYMLFNAFNSIAEEQLIAAVEELAAENINDLILDLRYNGGGLSSMASQLAYMVAGREQTQEQTFKIIRYNDKHPTTDPFYGEPIEPVPFTPVTLGYSTTEGEPLPALDLNRLFVLTTSNSCSASETLINGLRGIDMEVIQIGTTTCGKPFGFLPTDNCGTTYFTINYTNRNAKGFGEYADGFSPINGGQETEATLPGCWVADDFNHAFGDRQEALLATALFYRENGRCPEQSELPQAIFRGMIDPDTYEDGYIYKPLPMQNEIMD